MLDIETNKFYHIIDDDKIIHGGEIDSFETNEFGIPIPETFNHICRTSAYSMVEEREFLNGPEYLV